MRKLILSIVIIGLTITSLFAQKKEKIKGDRNITVKQTQIDDFKTIVISDDFSIEMMYNDQPSVEIEADDNLHEVITFKVLDSVLTFQKTNRITSKKKLRIVVAYNKALKTIETKGNSEVRSLNTIDLSNAILNINENSRAYLNISAKTLQLTSYGKTKSRLNLSADSIKVELNDNSKLDALINCEAAKFDLYQRTNANIEGTANNTKLNLNNSANFNGSAFDIKTLKVNTEDNGDLVVKVTDSITINAVDNSKIYLYGSPKINMMTFEGTSKLQKKKE